MWASLSDLVGMNRQDHLVTYLFFVHQRLWAGFLGVINVNKSLFSVTFRKKKSSETIIILAIAVVSGKCGSALFTCLI